MTAEPKAPALIPVAEIDRAALTRDRLHVDPAALEELALSILQQGLRNPVEVYEMEEPKPPFRYALVSGARRLAAYERLHYLTGQERWTAIPAWLRAPENGAEALALMVTENAVREDVSPWEKGRIAVKARESGHFETLDEAVKGLFPAVERTKAARIREAALAVEAFDGLFAEPWRLSMRQCLRLANAERDGAGDLIAHVIEEERAKTLEAQWALIEPILAEIETPPSPNAPKRKEGYPRRLKHLRPDLTIRREKTKLGYSLHFTGKYAQDRLMEDVLDDVIRRFEPAV